MLHQWSNDPEINYMLGGWHFPSNYCEQEKWHESLSLNSTNQRFAIDTKEHGLIGMTNLVSINWKDRNAFHGMLIGDKDIRGKGYGYDTVMTMNRYAFEELGLKRMDGSMIEYNVASINLYTKKCGWKIEGIKKESYFRKNKWWGQVIVGITKEDYDKLVVACDVGLIFLDRRFTIPNYPSRLLSYLENKLPIIAATDLNTDIGKLAEENNYGFACINGDLDKFRSYLDQFNSNRTLIEEMGENGYNFLLKNYTVSKSYEIILRH